MENENTQRFKFNETIFQGYMKKDKYITDDIKRFQSINLLI